MPDEPQEPRYLPVNGFDGYRVGDDGSVWTAWTRRGQIRNNCVIGATWKRLNFYQKRRGYLAVGLTKSGKQHFISVHRLVLEAFVGPCPPGMECRHFPDRNPANNRVGNLSWGTRQENIADKKVHGTSNEGERHRDAKLTEKLVRHAFALRDQGLKSRAISEQIGASQCVVCNILAGRIWKHLGLHLVPPREPKPRLTKYQVRRVFVLRARGLTQQKIGERLGVTASTVCLILRGKTWKHLAPRPSSPSA